MQAYKEFQEEESSYESQEGSAVFSQEREHLDDCLDSICEERAIEAPISFKPHTLISGKYKLQEMIGFGAFGVVYKAKNILSEDQEVAIKFPTMSDAKFERLCKEEQSLKKLVNNEFYHGNIIKLIDVGAHDKLPYLVLEYINGDTLQKRISEQAAREEFMDFEEFLDISIAITDAVQYAHDKGVVHRDIKPANIMIDKNNQVKVADFGLARDDYIKSIIVSASNPSMIGTPLYMAPEKKKGPEADVYSMAVMLFELLTNRRPDYSGTLPSEINKDIPKEIDSLYKSCVAFNPKERRTIKDIHDTLSSLKQAIEKKREKEKRKEEEQKKATSIDTIVLDGACCQEEIKNSDLEDGLLSKVLTGGVAGAWFGLMASAAVGRLILGPYIPYDAASTVLMSGMGIGAALGAVGLWQTVKYHLEKAETPKIKTPKQEKKVSLEAMEKKSKEYKSTIDEIHEFLFK